MLKEAQGEFIVCAKQRALRDPALNLLIHWSFASAVAPAKSVSSIPEK